MKAKFLTGLQALPSVAVTLSQYFESANANTIFTPSIWRVEYPSKVIFAAWGQGSLSMGKAKSLRMTPLCNFTYSSMRDIEQVASIHPVFITHSDRKAAKLEIRDMLDEASDGSGLFFFGDQKVLDGTFIQALGMDTTKTLSIDQVVFCHEAGVTVKGDTLRVMNADEVEVLREEAGNG